MRASPVARTFDAKTGVAAQLLDAVVIGRSLGSRDLGQTPQKLAAQTLSLHIVGNQKREFGFVARTNAAPCGEAPNAVMRRSAPSPVCASRAISRS